MTANLKQPTARETNFYPQSYLDRFMGFIERLPVPYWLTYLVLFLVQSIVMHIFAWVDGWLPVFEIHPLLFLFPLWQWMPLAIMTYADAVSRQALSAFGPLLDLEEKEMDKLRYEFTTMPSRTLILTGLAWGVVYVILMVTSFDTFNASYQFDTFFSTVLQAEGLIAYLTGSGIYYHSFRQLGLVNRTVKMVRKFNMFQLDPVYAFSRVTSLIGVSWMIMLSFTLLLFPIQLVGGLTLTILSLQVVLAIAAFILPLWFVHRRLEAEKLGLLAELNRQFETTTAKLHDCLRQNEMGQVTQLKDAMIGLTAERDILKDIPTWPWQSGTMTGFLSATILPIILLIIQLIIQRFMGG